MRIHEWRFETDGEIEARESAPHTVTSSRLLGDTFALWSRDIDLSDWIDSDQIGMILWRYSDIDEEAILSLIGDYPTDIDIGQPPWILSHPENTDQSLVIRYILDKN